MASIFPTGLTYSRNTKDPLQSKIVWNSLAEASIYVNNPDETAYVGMTLAVINDRDTKNNGLWYVEAIGTKSNPTAGVLKKVGSNEVLTAANYTEAVELAKTAPVGTLIKVTASEGSTEASNFRAAGFYIVSVSGSDPSILMLSTYSGEAMDLDAVIVALSDLQSTVATKANVVDVVSKTTYDSDKKTTDSDIEALKTKVGNKAEGDTQASGLYKLISDTEVALRSEIKAIPKFAIEVVESLPVDNISKTTVYLVKDKKSVGDLYTEYIYVNNDWENLGKQTVDLSSYSTTEAMNKAISAAISSSLTSYKEQVNDELDKKADASALSNYVLTDTFNTELKKKADTTALDAYLKIADIDTTLTGYVKQDSLNTQLEAYVKTDVFTTKLGDYVLKTSLSGSSISLVGDVYEVNTISTEDLNDIINPKVSE